MEQLNSWIAMGLIFLGLLLGLIGLLIRRHGQKKLANCTSKTSGQVYGYESRGNGLFFPLVQFEIEDQAYKGKLTYQAIIVKSSTLNGKAEIIGDKFAPTLRVKRNAHLSFNPVETAIPKGTELDVYYNPKNPKENYVQRFAKSLVGLVFIISAVLIILIGILCYFVI